MPKIVLLPSNFRDQALYSFVADVVLPEGTPATEAFVFDFARLWWIDGKGLTVFCNMLEWLRARSVGWTFQNFDGPRPAIPYLDGCGFFVRYLGRPLRPGTRVRQNTLPVYEIAPATGFSWLEHTATPWLAVMLGVSHAALASLRTSVKEIFNDIADHSQEEIGFVHVQHYPKLGELHVTVSDFGRGIPSSINAAFGPRSDAEAIKLAVEDGITAGSTPQNRGRGLRVLVDYVTANHGSVVIYSACGKLVSSRDADDQPRFELFDGAGSYPGTLVNIVLKTADFVGDDMEETTDFEW